MTKFSPRSHRVAINLRQYFSTKVNPALLWLKPCGLLGDQIFWSELSESSHKENGDDTYLQAP
jgi:hypothetical protein